jgi:hypothetical protein
MRRMFYLFTIAFALTAVETHAKDFKYKRSVTLKIGQSVVLKGVRRGCGKSAPTWAGIKGRLPRSKLGSFSDGGTGTYSSVRCGRKVGARGVKFTAKKAGKEKLVIFLDPFRITVK